VAQIFHLFIETRQADNGQWEMRVRWSLGKSEIHFRISRILFVFACLSPFKWIGQFNLCSARQTNFIRTSFCPGTQESI